MSSVVLQPGAARLPRSLTLRPQDLPPRARALPAAPSHRPAHSASPGERTHAPWLQPLLALLRAPAHPVGSRQENSNIQLPGVSLREPQLAVPPMPEASFHPSSREHRATSPRGNTPGEGTRSAVQSRGSGARRPRFKSHLWHFPLRELGQVSKRLWASAAWAIKWVSEPLPPGWRAT